MSDYPMLISNKLHSFRNFMTQIYELFQYVPRFLEKSCLMKWIKKQEGVSKV